MSNCNICSNANTCQTCSEGYHYTNSSCKKQTSPIANCAEYGEDGSCSKCNDNYAFKGENRTYCENKNNLENYYSKDEGKSYYPCENELSGCSKCYYDVYKNLVKCYLCKIEYALYAKDNLCIPKHNINKLFYYFNETHINNCSNDIPNCEECESGEVCTKCKNNFYMVNDFKKICIGISYINTSQFYLDNNQNMFYSCSNGTFHDVLNCKECKSKSNCTLCQDDYTFIDGNKFNCVKKSDLNNKYIPDPLDKTNFIKCERKYYNCDTCNTNQCISCKDGFTFINGNKSNCVEIRNLANKYVLDPLDESNYIKCENKYSICDTCNITHCLTCKNGFTFINGNKLNCFKRSDLNNTYVQDPLDESNYIKCENKYSNCNICNITHCLSCKNGFTFINWNKLNCVKKSDLNNTYIQDPLDSSIYIKCENKYNNCDTCNNNICLTCKEGFTFINGNKLNCVKKSDLNNIYIQDPSDQSNFIKCENRYSNCDTCNITHCLTCKNDYIFINRNKSSCFKMSDLYNKYIQDPLDPSIFIKCEYIYTNCDTCNNIHCLSCKSGFTFINGNKLNCVKKSDLDNTYIQDPSENTNYIKCENKYTNCNTCNNNQCLSCKNDFTFINGNKLNCIKRSELNNTYIQDPSDQYNYIKCEKKYKNCETCNNNQCSSCKNDFIFINGNKLNCVKKSDLNNTYIQDPLDPSNYIKCENKYNNCYICNTTQCLFCKTNYIFINGDKTTCLKKTDLNNKYIQDPSDKSNYFKCENKYSNCDSCTNRQCFSCKSGYIFINDDYTNCLLKSNIDLKFYYSKDNNMYYSCKLIKYRNNKECKKLLNEANSEEQEKTLVKQLYILQVQIINKLLKIFLTLTVNIEKGLHIKFSINLFKNRLRQRNLQGSSKSQEVNLYLDNVSGNIATLTSKEEFEETDRIVVNKEQGDEYELYLLNNDNKVLDTLENKKKIDNNKVVDFSEINSDYPVKKYYIESSSSGCSFNLVSKDSIRESNKEINLTFIQKDDINNNINAKCTLSSDNEKNIPCSLGEEFEEKNYNLQSYVGSNTNSLFYIFQDNDGYQLSCSDEKKDKDKKIIIIAIAAGGAALLGIIITIICCCCCKKKKVEKVHFPEKNFTIKETEENSFNNNNFDKKNKKNKKKKKKKKKKRNNNNNNNNNNNKKMSTYRDINNKRTNKKSK